MKKTPLHWAARNGEHVLLELLLKWGADVSAQDLHRWTPLHHACLYGDGKCVSALLDYGADVDAVTRIGSTPLFFVRGSNPALVELLVQKGANIGHRNEKQWTVLHDAAHWNRTNVIKAYVKCGALINAVDQDGDVPINLAIRENKIGPVSALLSASQLSTVRALYTSL